MSSISISNSTSAVSAGPRAFIRRYAVVLFFVLAFVLTWAIQIPLVLEARGMLSFDVPDPLLFVQGFMPGIAALIVAALASGRAGIMDLLRRVVRWRVGLRWYLIATLGTGAVYLGAVYGSTLFGAPAPQLPPLSVALAVPILLQFSIYMLFNWEDLGWRGFATPRMQSGSSALLTAIILGVVEGAFHIPLFFSPTSSQANSPLVSFMLLSVGGVILLNWVFNNTRGSVLLAMIFHAAANTWTDIVPIPPGNSLAWTLWAGAFGIIAIGVVVLYGARYLARKPDLQAIIVVDPIDAKK